MHSVNPGVTGINGDVKNVDVNKDDRVEVQTSFVLYFQFVSI